MYFVQKCGITPTKYFKGSEPESSYAWHYVSNMAEMSSVPEEEPGSRICTNG